MSRAIREREGCGRCCTETRSSTGSELTVSNLSSDSAELVEARFGTPGGACSIYVAAQSFIGTRFRLHGRDGVGGLDCVGLVVLAYARAGFILSRSPDDYPLRGVGQAAMEAGLCAAGLKRRAGVRAGVRAGAGRCGDVALIDCGHGQLHLAIMGKQSHIHAHAGLRRVVETPGMPDGMIAAFHII